MVRVNIQNVGKTMDQFYAEISQFWFEFQAEIVTLGEEMAQEMKTIISTNKKNTGNHGEYQSTGALENAITADPIHGPAYAGFGIGDVVAMDQAVPYWAAVNFGVSYVIPKGGTMIPQNREALKWIADGQEFFAKSVAQRPQTISPMNYIEQTEHRIAFRIAQLISELSSRR